MRPFSRLRKPRPRVNAPAGLVPKFPGGGIPTPVLDIRDVEGAHLLANEARPRLHAAGFKDRQILEWSDSYFAEHHEGDARELIDWIAEVERTDAVEGRET